MKILVIEDHEKLAKLLKKGLKPKGFTVDYVTDGEAGQKRIEFYHKDYDLVLLDLMLPKKNGLEVCKSVRGLGIDTPILVLTAKDDIADKVALLDSGADDYMVKPFSFNELLSRINAILRRPKQTYYDSLAVGQLSLDPQTRKVTFKNRELDLTLKEFSILEYLMQHPNQVINREQLIMNNWDFDVDSLNNIVDVYINRLRNKLDEKRNEEIIETVRGIGYRLKVGV